MGYNAMDEMERLLSQFEDASSNGGMLVACDTYADIVLCIDVTVSMKPLLDKVKELALSFYEKLICALEDKHEKKVRELRVKVIAFRDYYCDFDLAMQESRFFVLPKEKKLFKAFVEELEAKGGGDNPESSLEALALAMQSDWVSVDL